MKMDKSLDGGLQIKEVMSQKPASV